MHHLVNVESLSLNSVSCWVPSAWSPIAQVLASGTFSQYVMAQNGHSSLGFAVRKAWWTEDWLLSMVG